jgi:hypothetical protein
MITEREWAAVHRWIASKYGQADHCEGGACDGKSSTFHWALIAGKNYARRRANFHQLCSKCHRRYDIAHDNQNKYIKSTRFVRMFPSTYQRLRRKAFEADLSYPELLDGVI